MNTARLWDVLALASIGSAGAASAALYSRLPERVATHFDLHGNADGWMSRPWAAAFMPVVALGLWALVRFAPRVLPRSDEKRLETSIVALVAALTAIFMAAIHVVLLRVATTPGVSVTKTVLVLAGLLFVAIGLVLPRVKRNPIIGVRTAWTLRSDENWARTQRVGGYAMVLAGAGSVLAGGLGGTTGAILAIAGLIVAGIVPVVYSLVVARQLDSR
jgi:uncharacterized membrane protein